MKIAAAQISCALGEVAANIRKMGEFAERAKAAGADMVVFPEMSDIGYSMPVIQETATRWNEGAVPELQRCARSHRIAIVCGVSEREGDRIYNSQVVIDAQGEIIAKYRKMHLFTAGSVDEHACFESGVELASFAQSGLNFAPSICYDLRFPEVYRAQATAGGANVFLISSAWPFPRVEHLRTLSLARAIENQSYLLLANRVGTDTAITFCGNSAIIDPYGVVLAMAPADEEELIVADISLEEVRAVRSRMDVFGARRPELYSAGVSAATSFSKRASFLSGSQTSSNLSDP